MYSILRDTPDNTENEMGRNLLALDSQPHLRIDRINNASFLAEFYRGAQHIVDSADGGSGCSSTLRKTIQVLNNKKCRPL
jgi:hypothetical protein